MTEKLQNKLYRKYPKIFRQKDLSMQETCMCWGICVGDGWYGILDYLCGRIQRYCNDIHYCDKRDLYYFYAKINNFFIRKIPWKIKKRIFNKLLWKYPHKKTYTVNQVEAAQVKQKFGGLRFYIDGSNKHVDHLIDIAEEMCSITCEQCGTTKDIVKTKSRGGWISTLCKRCAKKLDYGRNSVK